MGSLWTGGPWALSSMNFWLDVCLSLGTLQKSYLDKSSVVNIKTYLYVPTGKQLLHVNLLCVTKMLTFIKHWSQQIKRTRLSKHTTDSHIPERVMCVEIDLRKFC